MFGLKFDKGLDAINNDKVLNTRDRPSSIVALVDDFSFL
jgi:hypothetical protein